ncbi:MAG: hypothetical protein EOO30_15755 [Comamonadaceae bacterium]|nr:MAG: hypothetical protein EOO30_15755 [Comamonadaceae bacterium]
MITVTWAVFAVLALLWTGGAAMAAALAGWTAQAIADGTAVGAAREIAAVPVPQWMALWMDTAFVEALQSALSWAVEAGRHALPFVGTAAGWLVPMVWIAWAIGLAFLLAAAATAHLLVRRFRPARRPA